MPRDRSLTAPLYVGLFLAYRFLMQLYLHSDLPYCPEDLLFRVIDTVEHSRETTTKTDGSFTYQGYRYSWVININDIEHKVPTLHILRKAI